MQTEQAGKSRRTALGAMTMCSCSNSSVQLEKEDIERLRCKLSRLKKAMTFGFVFKQRCSAQEGGHRTPEM